MQEIGKIVFWSIFAIGAWTSITSILLYLRDRSGYSGRNSHWQDNPRLGDDQPAKPVEDAWWDNLTDKDHEALGAMLHAMKPREDRKD